MNRAAFVASAKDYTERRLTADRLCVSYRNDSTQHRVDETWVFDDGSELINADGTWLTYAKALIRFS
jgi:hypothetical protein